MISSRMVEDVPICSNSSGFLGNDCERKLVFPVHIFDPAYVEPVSPNSRICSVLPVDFYTAPRSAGSIAPHGAYRAFY